MLRRRKQQPPEGAPPADRTEAQAAPSEQAKRITPMDIQQVGFRVVMRGYDVTEVDVFLDQVTEEVARLYSENKRLKEDAELQRTLPGEAHAAVEADAMLRQARDEATLIVSSARQEAEAIRRRLAQDQAAAEDRVREAQERAMAGPQGVAAPSPSPGGSAAGAPASRAALARLVARERDFLQSLASLIQGHAQQVKQELSTVRTGTEAAGPPAAADAGAAEAPRDDEPAHAAHAAPEAPEAAHAVPDAAGTGGDPERAPDHETSAPGSSWGTTPAEGPAEGEPPAGPAAGDPVPEAGDDTRPWSPVETTAPASEEGREDEGPRGSAWRESTGGSGGMPGQRPVTSAAGWSTGSGTARVVRGEDTGPEPTLRVLFWGED